MDESQLTEQDVRSIEVEIDGETPTDLRETEWTINDDGVCTFVKLTFMSASQTLPSLQDAMLDTESVRIEIDGSKIVPKPTSRFSERVDEHFIPTSMSNEANAKEMLTSVMFSPENVADVRN